MNDAKGPRTYKEVFAPQFVLPPPECRQTETDKQPKQPPQEIEYFGKRRKIIWRKEKPRKPLEDENSGSSEESSDEDNSGEDEADPYADVKLDSTIPLSYLSIRPN